MVYTLARRMLGARVLAEDVLQDVFVEVIRKAAQYRGGTSIAAWIKQIAVNKCIDQLRSPWNKRRAHTDESSAPIEPAADVSAETPLEHEHERLDELLQALDGLSRTARAVVWLHDVEGYSHREIGRFMGRSTSFSKSQLSRAHAELRRVLRCETTDEGTKPCQGALKIV
jgi:RNA polymerase sigma-70 factor (ECF subfamily)